MPLVGCHQQLPWEGWALACGSGSSQPSSLELLCSLGELQHLDRRKTMGCAFAVLVKTFHHRRVDRSSHEGVCQCTTSQVLSSEHYTLLLMDSSNVPAHGQSKHCALHDTC